MTAISREEKERKEQKLIDVGGSMSQEKIQSLICFA
jgi:hypothetical protein